VVDTALLVLAVPVMTRFPSPSLVFITMSLKLIACRAGGAADTTTSLWGTL
jgi:hypothetical protein